MGEDRADFNDIGELLEDMKSTVAPGMFRSRNVISRFLFPIPLMATAGLRP